MLDFTWVWAGPYCTLQLAHMGAEVIRVETTKRVCPSRLVGPFPDGKSGINRAGYFNQYNQGKRSIALDLSRPEGIEIACELVKHADIVADNFAAGVMERLGLGYEKLRSIKPDIIQISMSAFGQTGPFKGFIGYGPPAAALSGLFFGTGYAGGDPCEIGISYPDPNAGVFGAFAVMAALAHRAKTGEGQFIDQSQWETVLVEVAEGLLEYSMTGKEPVRKGNHDSVMAPYDCSRRPAILSNGCPLRSVPNLSGTPSVRRSGSRDSQTIHVSRKQNYASATRRSSTRLSANGPHSATAGKSRNSCRARASQPSPR